MSHWVSEDQTGRPQKADGLVHNRSRIADKTRRHHNYSFCYSFYLIQRIFYDNQHRRVGAAELPVERLEAGAMPGRAVSQLPGAAHRPGGKLLAQLEKNKHFTFYHSKTKNLNGFYWDFMQQISSL